MVVSAGAVALIESNKFDYDRHAVASDGEPGCSYEVRYNIFGHNSLASNTAHQVDVHGQQESGFSGRGWVAGTKQLIHHNTFQTSASDEQFCIAIQAVPITGA